MKPKFGEGHFCSSEFGDSKYHTVSNIVCTVVDKIYYVRDKTKLLD